MASSNPFRVGSQGWGTLVHQNHATGDENGSIMVGMFVSLCLTSKKPSEREFFVPAGTDLGVKLLTVPILEGTNRYKGVVHKIHARGPRRSAHVKKYSHCKYIAPLLS